MSRIARLDFPNYFYHIVARGQRKNPLFFSDSDKDVFISILIELLKVYDIGLFAFALMKNHFHLLVYRKTDSLAIFMKQLNTRYAMYFNKKYNLVGHVFQDRYKSFIVLDNYYLIYLIKYIHLNPVKAGYVENARDYKYSSARFYENIEHLDFVNKLDVFKGVVGCNTYIQFMGSTNEFPVNIYRNSIGSEELYVKFEKRIAHREESYKGERREVSTIDQIKDVLYKMGYSEKLFQDGNKWNRNKSEIKKETIIRLYMQGFRQSDIAKVLKITKSWVNKIVREKKI